MAKTRLFTILGRRGHVITEAFHAVGLYSSFRKGRYGPRRILGVISEVCQQLCMRKYRYIGVITDALEYYMLAWFIARIFSVPLLFRLRGDIETEIQEKNPQNIITRSIMHIVLKYSRFALRSADILIPVSNYLKERVWCTNRNVVTVPISVKGPEENHLPVAEENERTLLLSVTNFRFPQKVDGIIPFVPTIVRILERFPNVDFILAGRGSYKRHFQKKIDHLIAPVRSQFQVIGFIEKIHKFYGKASVYVHLSGLDAFPRAILEAQLAQVPVLATPVGGIPEMIEHGKTGYLVTTVDDVYNTTCMLLNNSDQCLRIGEKAREDVLEKYSPYIVGMQWASVIENLSNY